MANDGMAIGSSTSSNNGIGNSYSYDYGYGNSNNAESKKLAMTGSIFQGLIPPVPNASAIRA